MKIFVNLILVLLFAASALAQKDTKPSTQFVISGEVKTKLTVKAVDLLSWNPLPIADVVITNHLGEKKSEAKGLKGVLLKDVLQKADINAESPRALSEYYFVCRANDGYTVVYSWNELFNTATGTSAYIITEKDGKSISEMSDAILMLSAADTKTGRRHMKALISIEVKRAGKR